MRSHPTSLGAPASPSASRRLRSLRARYARSAWRGICAALAVSGCQPSGGSPRPPCVTSPPGGPFAARVVCAEMLIGGDGRQGDILVGNDHFRAVIRHPNASLTAIGVGGGTLIDAAPWDGVDELFEVIPGMAGGWIEVAEFEVLPDGVRLAGPIVDLPEQPATEPGAWRELIWRVDPEQPILHAEGADGLRVSPRGSLTPWPAGWIGASTAYLPEGGLPAGTSGLTHLAATSIAVRLASDPFDGPRSAGQAELAEAIELLGPDGPLARVPIQGSTFDLAIPDGVIGLRAFAASAEPGPSLAPGPALTLPLGPRGSARIEPGRWALAAWEGPAGPRSMAVPPEGAVLPVGPGPREITLSAGPAWVPAQILVDGSDGPTVSTLLAPAFDPGSRILVAASWDGERAFRAPSDVDTLARAAAAGLGWVGLTGIDVVGGAVQDGPILHSSAVRTAVDGLDVVSWTWPDSARDAGWGAPDPRGLTVADALARIGRTQVVPLAVLDALGEPSRWDPAPAGVLLDAPTPDLASWIPWFTALEAQRWVVPWGPRLWVDVDDPAALGPADVAQPLARGNLCATTGPLLALAVDGAPSGETVSLGPAGGVARIEVGWHGPVDEVRLIGPGPTVLATFADVTDPVEVAVAPGAWWIAVMTVGDEWAVTAPVLGQPSAPE